MSRKKVCFVAASEMTVKAFLLGPMRGLSVSHDVSLVVNTTDPAMLADTHPEICVFPVAIRRCIAPWQDGLALWRLFVLFRREGFDIVHSVTPKAGLLAMLAGRLAGIPVRIHTFTGQVWATRKGFGRWLLKTMDRILAASATHLLADSASQRRFLIDEGVVGEARIRVLAEGSISGVDVQRFSPDPATRAEIRAELGLSERDILFLFLGRLNRDKGVLELAQAFAAVAADAPAAHLLVVGPDEAGMRSSMASICRGHAARLHVVPYTDSPQRYMAAADVFCLPSYREGFGSVVIEAAAVGLPAIGTEIYGLTDAIEHGRTGILVPPADAGALATAMRRFLDDPEAIVAMGAMARERARHSFDSRKLAQAWLAYYAVLP